MKTILPVLIIPFFLVLASCQKQESEIGSLNVSDLKSTPNIPVKLNFRANLSGDQEVPPRETLAVGEAIFQLSSDGNELSYKLIVANLDNITMSHIHVAPAGVNGGIVVWLYPVTPPALLLPGTTNGILQQGVITKDKLVGALAGHELSDLVDLMIAEGTYVNVHTSQFGGGEIRGQIKGNVNEF